MLDGSDGIGMLRRNKNETGPIRRSYKNNLPRHPMKAEAQLSDPPLSPSTRMPTRLGSNSARASRKRSQQSCYDESGTEEESEMDSGAVELDFLMNPFQTPNRRSFLEGEQTPVLWLDDLDIEQFLSSALEETMHPEKDPMLWDERGMTQFLAKQLKMTIKRPSPGLPSSPPPPLFQEAGIRISPIRHPF